MSVLSQADLAVTLSTPLPDGTLILRELTGRETIGALFEFTLVLDSLDAAVDPAKVVGKGMTVTVALPDGGKRFLHGLVSRFAQGATSGTGMGGGTVTYYATLVPWAWMLTLSADCRIFQAMTAPEIIKKVCSDQGFTDLKDTLQGTYTARDY
ncbi:MAG: contractile injection system protein, VgrG/Pvc8 family, partial [Rhodospirillaceae bacterium]